MATGKEILTEIIINNKPSWDAPSIVEVSADLIEVGIYSVTLDDCYYQCTVKKKAGNKALIICEKLTNFVLIPKTLKTVISTFKETYDLLNLEVKSNGALKDVEFKGTDLINSNTFIRQLSRSCIGFNSLMEDPEFFEFINNLINNSEHIIEIQGVGFHNDIGFVYYNAITSKAGKSNYTNKDGFVIIDKKKYCIKPPVGVPRFELAEEEFDPEIIKELLKNLDEAFPKAPDVFLVIGAAIATLFIKTLIPKGGFPICFMTGKQSSGKTTVLNLLANLYGANKLYCGGSSTAYSIRVLLGELSSIPVLIDEISEKVMQQFTELVKDTFSFLTRAKGSKSGALVAQPINSSLIVTSNEVPELKAEVITRLIIATDMQIDISKYKYFDAEKAKKLSLIVPQVLKYANEDILTLYEQSLVDITSFLPVDFKEHRVKHNFAIALTGLRMLEQASGEYKIPDLKNKIADYFKKYTMFLEVDGSKIGKILDYIESEIIQTGFISGVEYNFVHKKDKIHLQLARNAFFEKYNHDHYYKQLSRKEFNCYAKGDPRILNTSTARTLNGKSIRVIELDITDRLELIEYLKDLKSQNPPAIINPEADNVAKFPRNKKSQIPQKV